MASRVIPTQAATDLPTFKVFSEGEDIGGLYGVLSVFVSKKVNKIPTARVILSDGDVAAEDFEVSNEDHFIPGKEIEIHAGYHNTEDPIFKGIVIKHGIKTQKGKASVLIVDLRDTAVKMTIGRKNKYFQEITDSDAIEELIGTYGLEVEVEATEVEHLELVQYYATDWDFMVSRAEVNGKLVFVDDGKVTVQKPDLSQEPLVELAFGHNVFEFEAEIDARDQYAASKSTAWDYSTQEILEEEGSDPGFEEQGNLSASDLADVIGLESWPQQHSGKVTDQELKHWSDAKLMRSRLAKIQGNIKMVGFSDIKPGHVITLAGFGDRFNGKAYVSAVVHHFATDSTWYTELTIGLSQKWFHNNYDDINESPASGLTPGIEGLQVGTVTNIHEDPEGEYRVKVRVPIISTQEEGVWARVALLDAGANRGTFFRPEVDDEVIVGFINNDPRDPVIMGMFHSSAIAPPIEPEEENKQKGIITKSELRLLFDDDLNVITLDTPNGNKIVVSEDEGGMNFEDENGNKILMNSDGITLESAADLILKASGDVTVEGTNLTNTANAQYTAEGSSGAELSTSGQAVIKGSIVQIN